MILWFNREQIKIQFYVILFNGMKQIKYVVSTLFQAKNINLNNTGCFVIVKDNNSMICFKRAEPQ